MRIRLLFFLLLFSSVARSQEMDVIHYTFGLHLNNKNDSIKGNTGIVFINKTDKAEVQFDLVTIDAGGKGMQVDSVKGREENNLRFSHHKNRLTIYLPEAIKDTPQLISIFYKGIPRDGLIISKNKFGERTFFADNWPNRAHHWIPCNDRPDDKANFQFAVTAPSQFKVISNGIKLQEEKLENGFTRTLWYEEIAQPTKVMVIGVARFAVKEYAQKPGGIPVSAWVYPKDSTKGFYDYGQAPDILQFFADHIGPYPYKKLANVQSTTIFGGMENASAIFYAESSVTGKRSEEDLLAHEIAHQWFGDAVSEKSFAHLWLSEGFATFFTNYYFEKKYGKEKARERWEKAREEVVSFALGSTQAVVDSTKNLMSLLNPNSYSKGAWVLHMLRNEVGDKNFQQIVQTYYQQYKGSNAETKDLQAIAEKISGKELTSFFDQWLYRPGIPVLQVSTKVQNDEFYLYVEQKGKPYHLTLQADFVLQGGEVVRKQFAIKDASHVFTVPVKGTSVSFALDPDMKLLYKLQ